MSQSAFSTTSEPQMIFPTEETNESTDAGIVVSDYISNLPDGCLACIFQSLGSDDRERCSLVCRLWLRIEGQSRHRLSLNSSSKLLSVIPSIFSRFDSVTKLTLKDDHRSVGIGDFGLILISLRCKNLTHLKLQACREITKAGLVVFAKNCKGLKSFSCKKCDFGAKGMNAVLDNCSFLEEFSVTLPCNFIFDASAVSIGLGVASSSLKLICLKEMYKTPSFEPLILASKNLRTLKLYRCSRDWDKNLKLITDVLINLVEIHLAEINVSDIGLATIANCSNLQILHLAKLHNCTNTGIKIIVEHCNLLRKLHIDGSWNSPMLTDEGIIAVAKHCPNLQELVLICYKLTLCSLDCLATNCQNLQQLKLCEIETIGDAEILCIASKCTGLKKLCIKRCPVSDHGMEALVNGCPNLEKLKVMCEAVTSKTADLLRACRGSLALDITELRTTLNYNAILNDMYKNGLWAYWAY